MYEAASKNFITRDMDKIEDFFTNRNIKNTANKYRDHLPQIILYHLKLDESEKSESYIYNLRRYRQDNRSWEKATAAMLERPDIIELVNGCDDGIAESVMKALGNYNVRTHITKHQDGTKEKACEIYQTLKNVATRIKESDVPVIINKLGDDNPRFDWYGAEKFAGILLNTDDGAFDEEIFHQITTTIDHYEGVIALSVLDGLADSQGFDKFDIESAKKFHDIMTTKEITEACNKSHTGNINYRMNGQGVTETIGDTSRAHNMVMALTAIAKCTQDEDTTKLAAEAFDNFDENKVGKIAREMYNMCWVGSRANYMPQVLKSINNLQETDSSTAESLGKNIGTIIDLLGNKTPHV
ncbi:MAG: hypothetical protein KAJ24_07165, partial [Candidatus Aenigmarchaeota archaeon]|nr:hypothetical protein [Candidatus Aenigmarchaeota archaeon]